MNTLTQSTAEKSLIQRVFGQYGLIPVVIHKPQKGYRNTSYPVEVHDGRTFNFVLYKNEPKIMHRIHDANTVSDFLADLGFPARKQIGKTIKLSGPNTERFGALYNYLPGSTIPWEAYSMKHLKLLGETMSNMHFALQQLPTKPCTVVADENLALLDRMESYFSEPGVASAIEGKLRVKVRVSKLAKYKKIFTVAKKLPGQQALHMDFVRGNILFDRQNDELEVSGILDFEKVAYGHRVFDIARTLAFLYVDCKYKSAAQVDKYFLRSGYGKRGKAKLPKISLATKSDKIDLLDELVSFYLCYDFYKLLRHNPYEFLSENEHYLRTRDILLQRDILLGNDRIR